MSGSLGISIEEVLRQHSVQELRQLIGQLEGEAASKQTELQQMVGSTYHDFIQSADTIAIMQSTSKQMRVELTQFGQIADDILNRTKLLLSEAANDMPSHSNGGEFLSRSRSDSADISRKRSNSCCFPSISRKKWSWQDITSCNVWNCLDECDIFSACQIMLMAESVLSLECKQDASETFSLSAGLDEFAAQHAKHMIGTFSASNSSSVSSFLQKCHEVKYLHQTVVDDCDLLFVYGQCNVSESARSLAGIAGLTMLCSDSDALKVSCTDGGKLLMKYLENTDLRLQDLCQILRTGSKESKDEVDLMELAKVLVEIVRLLQQTLFNVYTIFFNAPSHLSVNGSSGSRDTSGLFGGYLKEFLMGCLSSTQKQTSEDLAKLVQEKVASCYPQSGILTLWRSWVTSRTKSVQQACIVALGHLKSAHDVAKIQRLVLHQCFHFMSTDKEKSCPKDGDDLERANSVSFSTLLGFVKGPGNQEAEESADVLNIWNSACNLLLLPLTDALPVGEKRSSTEGSRANGGAIIWTHVFRKPFTTQVEKLLKVSCKDIFYRTKTRILQAIVSLGGCGVVHNHTLYEKEQSIAGSQGHLMSNSGKFASWLMIDPLTLEVSVRESLLRNVSSDGEANANASFTSQVCDNEWKWVDIYTGTNKLERNLSGDKGFQSLQSVASSSEVFVTAENIRMNLESDVSDNLLTDVFQQSNFLEDENMDSSSTLFYSLQVQCSELVGQLLVLLRISANKISDKLKNGKGQRIKSRGVSPEVPTGEAALQSGLLLLSRLGWMLQTARGTFMRHSLQVRRPAQDSAPSSPTAMRRHHHPQYMTSLEQLQSAFEIADTDGDGFVTLSEAIEAVNALWISDDSTLEEGGTGGGPSSFEFLWFDCDGFSEAQRSQLTLSIREFRLVCSQMIPPPAQNSPPLVGGDLECPIACMEASLSALVQRCLQTFSEVIVDKHLSASLLSSLQREYPFMPSSSEGTEGDRISGNANRSLNSFRHSWAALPLSSAEEEPVEEEASTGQEETMDAPCQPSRAAFRCFTSIKQILHATCLSVDTTQLLDPSLQQPLSKQNCLAAMSQELLFSKALETYLRTLESVFKQHDSRPSSSEESLQLVEDFSVQMMFDLVLCKHTLLASLEQGDHWDALFQKCWERWEQSIDPINWSLLSPLVQQQVDHFTRRNGMFFPCPSQVEVSDQWADSASGGDESERDTSQEGQSSHPIKEEPRFLSLFPSSDHSLPSGRESKSSSGSSSSSKRDKDSSVNSRFSLLPLPLTSSLAPYHAGVSGGGVIGSNLSLRGGKVSEYTSRGALSYSKPSEKNSTTPEDHTAENGNMKKANSRGWFF